MLFTIILKNLKIILRSPFTVLLLILAPMLLMLLIGFAYNSTNIVNTKVGIFGNDVNIFDEINGIDFINYNSLTLEESQLNCLNDLKRSNINLCMYVKTTKENNELISADITYFNDNTRNSFSEILINIFNRRLDEKTKVISTQTVEDIMGEIDSSLKLIEQARDDLEELESGLKETKTQVDSKKDEISNTINKIQTLTNSLLRSKDSTLNSLDRINSIKEENILNNLEEDIKNSLSSMFELKNEIESVQEELVFLGLSFKEIDDILEIIDSQIEILSDSKDNAEEVNTIIELIDKNKLSSNLETLFGSLETLEPSIESFDSDFNLLTSSLDSITNDISQARMKVDEKYNYFDEIASQDSSRITQPITTKTEPLKLNFQRVHQLAPTIIVLVLLFIGLLLSNVIVSLELSSKAYFRNLISPISQRTFILALFFTSLIIIFFQIGFFLLVLQNFFKIQIFTSISEILIIILHVLTVFILLGILLSYMFESMQVSIIVTTFIILFLFLLSNVILPLELMPKNIGDLLLFNPVVIGEDLLRRIFYYKDFYILNLIELVPFYIYSGIFIFLIIISNYLRKKRLF